MAEFSIRIATTDDARALAALGERTFRDTFAADNTPENLAAHLAATYGNALQLAELRDPACAYVVAEDARGLIGFALLHDGVPAPPDVPGAATNLARIYVDHAWHGRGVGRAMMREACRRARRGGARHLWLTVWERNPGSIAFYLRLGFRDVGATAFWVGADRQADRVMVRALGSDDG